MIYLKQVKLTNPAEVEGPVEDLKYPLPCGSRTLYRIDCFPETRYFSGR